MRRSILIVTFHSASTIGRCLASLIPTLEPEDEVIVSDNASSDATVRILRDRFVPHEPRVRPLTNPVNEGYSKAANQCASEASGETLVFLNPDTAVRSGWLERLCAPLQTGKIAAAGPISNHVMRKQFVGEYLPPNALRAELSHEELDYITRISNAGVYVPTKLLIGFCLAVRASVFRELAGFDEAYFLGSEDLDFCWRLGLAGYEMAIATDTYVEHQGHVSFGALPPGHGQRHGDESARVLREKMRQHYAPDPVPSDFEIWGL